ncbi:MAG: hypothetical protein COW63_04990 [Bacteroidetes bacterium CG18_big_fil_WC_8_21_14_2_50_41_14]|nr:MAG: hypothetical protein COW63_04990 [Bacteroidetes bacterium CG18_big_fil_WC_8_21_14_2_50_41_14]
MNQKVIILLLLVSAGLLSACSKTGDNDLPTDIPVADFEKTWSVVDEWYPYLEYKKIDWDQVHDVYYPLITSSHVDEYLQVINQMLLELKDGHVGIYLTNGTVWGYRTPRQIKDENSFDFSVTEKYLTEAIHSLENGKLQYGFISKIGYIRISTFSGYGGLADMDVIFHELRNTSGLIIDVRHNGGGNSENAGFVVSRCIQEPMPTPGWTEKGLFKTGPTLQPNLTDNYSNSIVVLVNGKSFSTTEHFTMWMQQTEKGTIVGDTTGGGSGNPMMFLLPSGNQIRVSTRFFYRYDGEPIECNGIVPDIVVGQNASDIQAGTDKQMEAALEFLQK